MAGKIRGPKTGLFPTASVLLVGKEGRESVCVEERRRRKRRRKEGERILVVFVLTVTLYTITHHKPHSSLFSLY